ncbi:MAG: virulence protein RhuM/Fic/DOC family protein [Candidatus Paceibacterota bacterium]
MKNKKINNKLVIFQAKNGAIELRGDFSRETLWATQAQIAEVFSVTVPTINEHLTNIFKNQELNKNSVIRKFRITANDGKTYNTQFYNLDVIISIGYRVNSKTATQFRQWATNILKEHLIKGYTINRKQILKNYNEFMKIVADIQILLPENIALDPKSVLELIKEFASTWVSLDAYDKETLTVIGSTKKTIKLTGTELSEAIMNLRFLLIKNFEATEIFAQEREQGGVAGIVGNVMQSFGGKSLYETLEEKAAHLLYFMVKNHPFVDGNKRSGAFAFIWFLRKAKIKTMRNINPSALTALTLLIAESDPKHKDKMVALVVELLRVNKR